MLDIQTGATAPPDSSTPPIEFLTIQLMPLAEGGISASLRSTTFDETDFELLPLKFSTASGGLVGRYRVRLYRWIRILDRTLFVTCEAFDLADADQPLHGAVFAFNVFHRSLPCKIQHRIRRTGWEISCKTLSLDKNFGTNAFSLLRSLYAAPALNTKPLQVFY